MILSPPDKQNTPGHDELLFFLFFKIRVYKWNNEQLIDASLFLFFVDPLLDWNPNSCGDDGSTLNLDDFFYFFGECCLKKNQNAPRPSEHSPVRGRQNKRLGGTIGYYYDKVGL